MSARHFAGVATDVLLSEDEDKLDEEFIAAVSAVCWPLLNSARGLTDYLLMQFKVNALGAVHAVNAFLPLLRAGATKKIAIIGTEGGQPEFVWKLRFSEMAAYGSTKASEEIIMTKYAALLEPEGFTVIAISPGFVDTSATVVEKSQYCLFAL